MRLRLGPKNVPTANVQKKRQFNTGFRKLTMEATRRAGVFAGRNHKADRFVITGTIGHNNFLSWLLTDPGCIHNDCCAATATSLELWN